MLRRRPWVAVVRRAHGGASVRLRFAPSPTGELHLGGARTALFNYLVVRGAQLRGEGGALILRIDDTDAARNVAGGEEGLMRELKWLGIAWDEGPDVGGAQGPYRQSERCDHYADAVEALLKRGAAYRDFSKKDDPPDTWARWRDVPESESDARRDEPHSIRFKARFPPPVVLEKEASLTTVPSFSKVCRDATPLPTRCLDAVRGALEWPDAAKVLREDFVLRRRDGGYLYTLCTAVDDVRMGITHVCRADEHLSNTLSQVLVACALGATPPNFAHCGLVTDDKRQKLSKRSKQFGATIGKLRTDGATPLGVANYLAGLGWNAATAGYGAKRREIFASLDDLALEFDLSRISPSPSCVDAKRLRWVEAQCASLFEREAWCRDAFEPALRKALGRTGAEAPLPCDFVEASSRLLGDDLNFSVGDAVEATVSALRFAEDLPLPEEPRLLDVVRAIVDDLNVADAAASEDAWQALIKRHVESTGLSKRDIMMTVRAALTSTTRGPCVRRQLEVAAAARRHAVCDAATLEDRLRHLRAKLADSPKAAATRTAAAAA